MALRHQNLAAHEINAGHHLCDRVLHLNARIDLDEIPLAAFGVHQKLDGSGVVIARRTGQPHGGIR